MELDGTIALFERSMQYRKLIYKTYTGDGDSKAYSAVCNSMPFGPLVYITKEECSAHIIKRMGTGLRTIIKNNKSNIPQLLSYSFHNSSLTFLYQILTYFKSTSSFSNPENTGKSKVFRSF